MAASCIIVCVCVCGLEQLMFQGGREGEGCGAVDEVLAVDWPETMAAGGRGVVARGGQEWEDIASRLSECMSVRYSLWRAAVTGYGQLVWESGVNPVLE